MIISSGGNVCFVIWLECYLEKCFGTRMMNINLGRAPTLMTALGLLLMTVGAVQSQDQNADYTEPYQQHALQIYRTSIAYRTTASHGEVPAFANYIANQFRAGNFGAAVFTSASALPDRCSSP